MCIAPWPRWSTIRDWIGSQPHSTGCDSEAANRFCRRDDSRTDQQSCLAELKRRERRTDSLFGLGASAALAGPLSFSSSAKKRPSSVRP